jgi:ATP-dependent Lon protease
MPELLDIAGFEADVPVLALRNRLLFPGVVSVFDVGREKSIAAVDALVEHGGKVLAVFAQRDPVAEDPGESDLYAVGCAALVRKRVKHSSGNCSLVLEGAARLRLGHLIGTEPYLRASTTRLEETTSGEAEGISLRLREAARRSTRLVELFLADPEALREPRTPGALADFLAGNADLPLDEQARLLATVEATDRQLRLLELLR